MKQKDLDDIIKSLPPCSDFVGDYYRVMIHSLNILILFKKESVFLPKIGTYTFWIPRGTCKV